MNCKDFENYGSAYIDNMLTNEEKLEFENHINSCKCCKIQLENLKIIIESYNEIEEVELPINFSNELKDKLEAEKINESKFNRFNNRKKLSLIAAGVFIIITSVSLINNASNYNNRNNLYSEMERSSENQDNIVFDTDVEKSSEPIELKKENAMMPKTMNIENTDIKEEPIVGDSAKEIDENNNYNIMTANEDSLEKSELEGVSPKNNNTLKLFGLIPLIIGMGVLLYKKFKK